MQRLAGKREVGLAEGLVLGGVGVDERRHVLGVGLPVVDQLCLTDKLADGLANTGVKVLDRKLRAPHVLSLYFPKGMATDLPKKLAAENVYAAPRLGRLRISPHVYNDEQDVERFVEVFRKVAM